ncbi:MAG: methylated-DNA--[protein]-cysteine S-methyltransferase [Magnetovibrio sp.]|nr:methylated-DNA--[protein]-cysteine S-methyltransferase [Magnetovibrio sp.]
METLCIKSPVGELTLFAEDAHITALCWGRGADAPRTTKCVVLAQASKLLADYFKVGHADFSALALNPRGTPFQKRVWQRMTEIPTGHCHSYGEVAKHLNSGPRAVGGACGANPIPIIIPCHRIINANGKIGNYSGGDGVQTKKILLRLEGTIS